MALVVHIQDLDCELEGLLLSKLLSNELDSELVFLVIEDADLVEGLKITADLVDKVVRLVACEELGVLLDKTEILVGSAYKYLDVVLSLLSFLLVTPLRAGIDVFVLMVTCPAGNLELLKLLLHLSNALSLFVSFDELAAQSKLCLHTSEGLAVRIFIPRVSLDLGKRKTIVRVVLEHIRDQMFKLLREEARRLVF